MTRVSIGVGVCLVALTFGLGAGVSAQDTAARAKTNGKAKASDKKLPAAFQPPDVDASLPNVLLIGDSISIGYHLAARKALAGRANVWRPPTNCGPTTNGLAKLDDWIGETKWDVIHFNFGLHDLKHLGQGGKGLAKTIEPNDQPQVPISQYGENLAKIAARLKATGATVIWRETTPVPEGSAGRVAGDAKRYNEAAAIAIRKVGGIQTDPMYDFAIELARTQRPANVHYTVEGSKLLGQHVAEIVAPLLPKAK